MLADGRARLTGGTVEITDPAAREQLLAAGHATVSDDGELRSRQTRAARDARQRLIDTGQAPSPAEPGDHRGRASVGPGEHRRP